jgi:hypothetical protein
LADCKSTAPTIENPERRENPALVPPPQEKKSATVQHCEAFSERDASRRMFVAQKTQGEFPDDGVQANFVANIAFPDGQHGPTQHF